MADIKTVVKTSLIEIAKEFLQLVSKDLDKYTSKKGVVKIEGNSVVLLTPSHIQWAKYGRGPGKQPPIDIMIEYVKKGRIKFDGLDTEGTAWAMAAGIAKNGTANWKRGAPNALEEQITKNFESYNKKLASMLSVEIDKQVNGIYEEKVISPGIKKFKI